MPDNLFQYYIIGGGWVMLLLVPASIVAVAAIFRGIARLWGRSVRELTNDVRMMVREQRRYGAISYTDARMIAADNAMAAYAILQPLSAVYALAPMLGALGCAWQLAQVWNGPESLRDKNLSAALEQAFVPLGWGLVIGLIAILGYAILRGRLVRVEMDVLAPAAIDALNEGKDESGHGLSAKGSESAPDRAQSQAIRGGR